MDDRAGGLVTLSGYQSTQYRDQWAIDALVRADGFAGSITRFAGSDREKFFTGKATITMHRGERIALHFRLPQGLRLPDDFAPRSILPATEMRSGSCGTLRTDCAYEGHMPDFNFLNVKQTDRGRFAFRLAGVGPVLRRGSPSGFSSVLRKRAVDNGRRDKGDSGNRATETSLPVRPLRPGS